jgi:hypothetical protein
MGLELRTEHTSERNLSELGQDDRAVGYDRERRGQWWLALHFEQDLVTGPKVSVLEALPYELRFFGRPFPE